MRALVDEHRATCTERTIQGAIQFRLSDGAIINVYETGPIAFQGKATSLAKTIMVKLQTQGAQLAPTGLANKVNSDLPPDPAHAPNNAPSILAPERVEVEHIQISVSVPLVHQLSSAARIAFQDSMQKFADDLANEAERLEQGNRAGQATEAEFTSSMVYDAYRYVRRGALERKSSKLAFGVDVAYAIAGPCFGAMTNYFHSAWQGTVFAGLFFAWLLTLIVKIARREGQEL